MTTSASMTTTMTTSSRLWGWNDDVDDDDDDPGCWTSTFWIIRPRRVDDAMSSLDRAGKREGTGGGGRIGTSREGGGGNDGTTRRDDGLSPRGLRA